MISPFVVPRIGVGAARRYFLTGERFGADVALRIGLVHEVAGDLDAAVEAGRGRAADVRAPGGPRGEAACSVSMPTRASRPPPTSPPACARARRARTGCGPSSSAASRAGPPSRRVRRLLLLVGAIIFVDTMFFAALTPLLPGYADDLDLSKAGVGVLAAAYPAGALAGGIPGGSRRRRGSVSSRPSSTGLLLMVVDDGRRSASPTSIVVLDLARFAQGFASAFTWTASLAWLVSRGARRAARAADRDGDERRDRRRALRARPRRDRVGDRDRGRLRDGRRRSASCSPSGRRRRRRRGPQQAQPLSMLWAAVQDRAVLGERLVRGAARAALLDDGRARLAAPRRARHERGRRSAASSWSPPGIEAVLNPAAGRISDVRGRLLPIRVGLAASAVMTRCCPGRTIALGARGARRSSPAWRSASSGRPRCPT